MSTIADPSIRIITPRHRPGGTGPERDEWLPLTGFDTAEEIGEAIVELIKSTEWEIIQTDGLPAGLDENDLHMVADYMVALAAAESSGIPAEVYLSVCEEHSATVNPDSIIVYGEGHTDEDIALAVADGIGSIEELLGDRVDQYIDWDKLGRDLRFDGFEIIEGTIVRVD